MSIYTNPVYNPTTVPYTKLTDEQPFDLILAQPSNQEKYRRKHRIVSAVSCVLCSLAITFTFMAATLAIYGVFGRAYIVRDLEEQEFEHFLHMTQGSSRLENGGIQFPYQRRVRPFPKYPLMSGRVIPTNAKNTTSIQHAQCPLMNLIECNKESFDGYSLQEHQQRIDLKLGREMLSGRLNTSYAVNNARHIYKLCVREYDHDKHATSSDFARELLRIKEIKLDGDSAEIIANITAHNRLKFGVNTLFQVEVAANYLQPESNRPYIMYLDQKLPPPPNAANLALMRQAFQSLLSESDYQLMYLNVPRIRDLAADSENSNEWKSFTSAEAYARWPFFDFTTYLSQLNQKHQFAANVKEFLFVVKTPAYFDQLNALFMPSNKNDTQEKLDLFKMLSIYTVFAEYEEYFGIDAVENEMRNTYKLGKSSTNSHPSHFIFSYADGNASYEALRFCTKELRQYLPHIASAVYADFTSDFPLQEEMQRFEALVETVRDELIEWVQESEIDQKLEDILIEKLRKVGALFTTRESLERDSFEEAHQNLQLTNFNTYTESVADVKNFLFGRQLNRINSKIEALRSSSFSESSAASITVEYSRFGNYLNVPSSVLMSPILVSSVDSPRTMVYSNLVWIVAREMSKAIDSEGILYNALGVHKAASDLTQMQQLWTESQTCLQSNIHNAQLDGTSKAIVVKKSINEIVGLQIAYRTFEKEVTSKLGSKTMMHRSRSSHRNASLRSFFQTSTSVYCSIEGRGASIALLDKSTDTFIKKHSILGCNKNFINFKCDIELSQQ